MLGLDFHLISIFCLHRALYKIQRWKKVLGKKKSRPQKERKGIILSRKENIPLWKLLVLAELHACVQISTKEVAVKPKFAIHDGHYCVVLLNAPLSDRGKKVSAMGYFSREIFIHRQWRWEVPLFYWFAVSRGIIYTTNQNIEKARHIFVHWCFVN